MQIVGVPAKEIDAMLEGGVGPSLEPDQDCPDCGGKFIRWGSYIRMVRRLLKIWKLRVRRVRCKGCGRTHALLPSFCYSNRLDCSEAIWGAITAKAGGRGHRPIADSLGLPHPTVRSWLRRLRDTAKPLRHHFVVLSESFGAVASRAPPEDSLAALVEAVRTAHFAATSRLGEDATGRIFEFSSASCRGWLLTNTSSLLASEASW